MTLRPDPFAEIRGGFFSHETLVRIYRQSMSTNEAMAAADGIRALLSRVSELEREAAERETACYEALLQAERDALAESETLLAKLAERETALAEAYARGYDRASALAMERVREVEAEREAALADYQSECAVLTSERVAAEARVREVEAERDKLHELWQQAEIDTERKVDAELRATVARQAGVLQEAREALLKAWNAIPARGDTWIEPSKTRARTDLAQAAERLRRAVLASPEAALAETDSTGIGRDSGESYAARTKPKTGASVSASASPEAAAAEPPKTREAWIDERVERYAARLCPAFWHNEGHSSHSTCPSCDGTFMRGEVIAAERRRLEHFASRAEAYALDVGLAAALPAVDAPPEPTT